MTHPELPQNIEAEKATIGSCLLNREAIVKAATLVQPSDFYLARHTDIYAAILDCYNRRVPPDVKTVLFALKTAGKAESVGGIPYLSELVDSVPTSYHVEHYAAQVKRTALLRAWITYGGKVASLGYGESDPSDVEAKALVLMTDIGMRTQASGYLPIGTAANEMFGRMIDPESTLGGVPTGYRDYDELTGGLYRGDLTILAARPSVGKTSMALCVAVNVADAGGLVLVNSLEMTRDQLLQRLVAMRCRLDLKDLRMNRLSDEDRTLQAVSDAFDWASALPLEVDEARGVTVAHIRNNALRVRAERGPIALLVVDYLQLMGDTAKKNSNREQDVSAISRGLKNLAGELDCPVWALSQLSRAAEGQVPQLSHLRESGALEQDADNVVFIYREELYKPDTDKKGTAELIISKQRQGPLGMVTLRFDAPSTRFDTLTYRSPEGY